MPFYGKMSKKSDLEKDYDNGLEIRGRKFYWHANKCQTENAEKIIEMQQWK